MKHSRSRRTVADDMARICTIVSIFCVTLAVAFVAMVAVASVVPK